MPDPEKTPVEKNVASLVAQVTLLDSQVTTLTAERDEALKQLKSANDLIEADTKARLIEEALKRTTYKVGDLVGKDVDDLEMIIQIAKVSRTPKFEASAADANAKVFDARTYLHDVYVGRNKGGSS